jgi:hypothetical protein
MSKQVSEFKLINKKPINPGRKGSEAKSEISKREAASG